MIKKPKKSKKKVEDNVQEDPNLLKHKRRLYFLKVRRNFRHLEIRIYRIRSLIRFISILLIMYGIYRVAYLHYWYLPTDTLTKYPSSRLEIEGNDIISINDIIGNLKVVKIPKTPLYALNTKPIEKSLMKLSPVKKVYVRRFWLPTRLKLVIEEKKPVISVTPTINTQPVAVFAADGTIIGKKFLPLHSSHKVFSILTYDDYTKWNITHVNYILQLCQLLEANSKEKLLYLDIRNANDVFAQLQNVTLRIGELDGLTFRRTERIGSVLTEALKIKDKIDYIDLRWNNSISLKLKNKNKTDIKSDKSKISDIINADTNVQQ